MTLKSLLAFNFTGTGRFKSLLCATITFHFWHNQSQIDEFNIDQQDTHYVKAKQ
tara:strand:+ start:364 stop:525 length:162 start_codon:yes stop_codon:yes gene_type:complete